MNYGHWSGTTSVFKGVEMVEVRPWSDSSMGGWYGFLALFRSYLCDSGDDGHTASLFPYQENNNVDDFVIYNQGKGLKRISLTPKVFSASSKIVFLVSGTSKQLALKRLLDQKEPSDRTPSKLIKSINQILIFCDQESAKDLLI